MVNIPPNYAPAIIQPQQQPQAPANFPQLPISPPSGGGTSSGFGANTGSAPSNVSTIPTIPFITDLGTWINGLFKTNIDPTILGIVGGLIGIVLILWIVGMMRGKPVAFKSTLPPITR